MLFNKGVNVAKSPPVHSGVEDLNLWNVKPADLRV